MKARAGSQVAKLEEARALVASGTESAPGEAPALLADVLGVVDSLMAKLARPGQEGMTPDQVKEARGKYEAKADDGSWLFTAGQIASEYGCGRATFYRLVVRDKPRT
jgi:hypothetical protein